MSSARRHKTSPKAPVISRAILQRLFSYDPETGVFRHKTKASGRVKYIGAIAGSLTKNGYIAINLPGGKKVLAHRLAWFWIKGRWPKVEIDHFDGDRANNRISNLRKAGRVENSRNSGLRRNNTTGRVGVGFDRSRQRFTAKITVAGKTINLGRFSQLPAAIAARQQAETVHFGTFRPSGHIGYREG